MAPRLRVALIVAAVAAGAAAVAVAAAVLQSSSTKRPGSAAPRPCAGGPPLLLQPSLTPEPGLRRALALYESARGGKGSAQAAARAFSRLPGVEARVGAAFARGDGLRTLTSLTHARPRNGFVRLHLGLALYCAGQPAAAAASWRAAERVAPDSASAITAEDFLHPQYFRGQPTFTPSFALPHRNTRVTPSLVRALARAAERGGVRDRLAYGVVLLQLQHRVSAERQFALAARSAPGDVDAQVAAAVGAFDKDRPARAFGKLGPLTARFPRSASVRYHLGLLLLWLGQIREGERQLRLAVAVGPRSPLAREAKRLLASLEGSGTRGGAR